MVSKNSRWTYALVIGVCLMAPMAMYTDSKQQNEKLLQALTNEAQGGDSSFDVSSYVTEDGRGGPAVGIEALLRNSDASGVINSSGAPIEVVRVETETGGLATKADSKKVVHVKIAETVWPVEQVAISSDFGWRQAPCEECGSDHRGVDFIPGAGTDVFSVYQGIVTAAGWYGGYGNRVEILHYVVNDEGGIDTWTTLYAHLQNKSIPKNVYVGAVVNTGTKIGLVGNTGTSTGDHLHFELIINGKHVDPMPILGHYELVELTEEELTKLAFDSGVPTLGVEKMRD